jgi:hypothetical protein
MNLKRIALILGIALIPAWYLYRTLSEHRITRLTWNEVFQTEDERLRKEVADEKERAQKEIDAVRYQYSEEKRRHDAANCVALSKVVSAQYARYVAERDRWKSDLVSLSHTKGGVAIGQNEDYTRAFLGLHQDRKLAADLEEANGMESLIEFAAEACARKQPEQLASESETERLEVMQIRLARAMEGLIEARLNVEALEQLATGESPKSLEEGARRQRMRELIVDLRARRRNEFDIP